MLAYSLVTHDGASPSRFVAFLHGILGSGTNWRSIARRLVAAHPTWGAVLVDLRAHGASRDFPPPHGVREAAADLDAIAENVTAVVGHSFGGKVALAYLERHPLLDQVMVLDSNPGPRPTFRGSESTVAVVKMLRELDVVWASRKAFVAAVVERGHPSTFAEWLALNLERRGESFGLRLDLDVIDALLADYFAIDLWPIVESSPVRIGFVVGGRSNVLDADDCAHVKRIADSSSGRVSLDVLENAGHWVHTDDPDGLFAVLSRTM